MKTKKLIKVLQELDQEAIVFINVMQTNKASEVALLNISSVNKAHSGATITAHLPDGAYIAKMPKTIKN